MANTYLTNVIFTLDILFSLSNHLIYTLFLTFEFEVIFEIFAFENNKARLKIFFLSENMVL